MKYPQSVPMTRDVEDWLQSELEARGINASVYTRPILSLLQPHFQPSKGTWISRMHERAVLDLWRYWDDEALKRQAVVRTLMSASDQADTNSLCIGSQRSTRNMNEFDSSEDLTRPYAHKYDIESLVDELCTKLKEIQEDATDADKAFPKCDCTPPFAADLFDCGLAPSREGLERGGEALPTTGWTRGLLRASLDQTNPGLPYEDTVNVEDCFSMMYCGQQKSIGLMSGLFLSSGREELKNVKRLYERTAPTAQIFPNPYDCFFNTNFSPIIFSHGIVQEDQQPQVTWSLGGANKPFHAEVKEKKDLVEETSCGSSLGTRNQNCEPAVPIEEEDLLTSARTHFRPIRSEEPTQYPSHYADGTTFAISTELDEPPFQRSESGTLFLANGKYLEFKLDEDNKKEGEVQEFVPKFRVRQSNEKFCQTDDFGDESELEEQLVPCVSSESSEASLDEFYFPGDNELAQDIDSEELPGEEEIIQIVGGGWEAVQDVIDKSLLPPNPDLIQITDLDKGWEMEFSNISNLKWRLAEDNCENDGEDQMDGGESDGDDYSLERPAWPQLMADSIWNPTNPGYSCEGCKGGSNDNLLAKSDWQEIWGAESAALCNDCREGDTKKSGEIVIEKLLKAAINETNSAEKPLIANESLIFGNNREIGHSSIWSTVDPSSRVHKYNDACINQSNNYEDDERTSDTSADKGPRLRAVFTAYLEEKRNRAFEKINAWSPFYSDDESFGEKPKVLRELWSPINNPDDDGFNRLVNSEWREIWSPIVGLPNIHASNIRAATYSALRDELSEDGDQLLSDLSYLHLHQQSSSGDATDASDVPEDDAFPTVPPSPNWEKSNNMSKFRGNWGNVWEFTGEDNHLKSGKLYNPAPDTAQKERKRRNSSSQKVCELYLEGDCRRPHCRFLHNDAAVPCPFYDDASCLKGDACPLSHAPTSGRELQRAFTL